MIKFLRFVVLMVAGFAVAGSAYGAHRPNKANQTKHTIKASARPFKAVGHVVKQAAVTTATFSFSMFDATVIDPLGVALQAFADGVDMFVAAPLESLPEPFESLGDGVHVVYRGIDKVGQQLAK